MSAPAPQLLLLAVALAVAVVFDLKYRRIPNIVCGITFIAGLIVRAMAQGPMSALAGFGGAALVLFALLRPWQLGGIGGGDVKLAAATATWIDFDQLVWFALVTAVAGGVVAAACYLLSRSSARADIRANLAVAAVTRALPSVPSHRQGHPSVPYAVAIAAGATLIFLKG